MTPPAGVSEPFLLAGAGTKVSSVVGLQDRVPAVGRTFGAADPGIIPSRQRAQVSTKRSRATRSSDLASACLRQSAIFVTRPSMRSIRVSL